jgi:type II secretory pathway component PulF
MKGKVIGALVVAFLIYFVLTKPQEAAEGVNAGADKMGDGASSLGTFIGALGPVALGIIALVGIAWWLMKK